MIKRVRSLVGIANHMDGSTSSRIVSSSLENQRYPYRLRFKNPRHDNVELKFVPHDFIKMPLIPFIGCPQQRNGKKRTKKKKKSISIMWDAQVYFICVRWVVGEHSHFIKSTPRATIQTHEIKYQKLFSVVECVCGVEFGGVFVESVVLQETTKYK